MWGFILNLCTGKSELQVYKQKVKHLLYEHQNSLTSLKADHEMWLKMQAEESSKRELDLQKDKRSLKQESKEQVIPVPLGTRASAVILACSTVMLRDADALGDLLSAFSAA